MLAVQSRTHCFGHPPVPPSTTTNFAADCMMEYQLLLPQCATQSPRTGREPVGAIEAPPGQKLGQGEGLARVPNCTNHVISRHGTRDTALIAMPPLSSHSDRPAALALLG